MPVTWSWCTWSRPLSPRTQRAWPAHQAEAIPGGDGAPLVVVGKPAGLGSNPLEQTDH